MQSFCYVQVISPKHSKKQEIQFCKLYVDSNAELCIFHTKYNTILSYFTWQYSKYNPIPAKLYLIYYKLKFELSNAKFTTVYLPKILVIWTYVHIL